MDHLIPLIRDTVIQARTLEELTRPLLACLQSISQLESVYLTKIDLASGEQKVIFSCNEGTIHIQEGITLDWNDSVCRRAMETEQSYMEDVSEVWKDSAVVRSLGLRAYISAPIKLSQGHLFGTLCAASTTPQKISPQVQTLVQLFAGLIGHQVERELLLKELQQRNQDLATFALSDALTHLPNRHALMQELPRMWARATREKRHVLMAFIDLDGFKPINDQYGHKTGDLLLQKIASQIKHALRENDFAARVGGDEFVMVSTGPLLTQTDVLDNLQKELEERLTRASQVAISTEFGELQYPGASVGVVSVHPDHTSPDDALVMADQAMYTIKAIRNQSQM